MCLNFVGEPAQKCDEEKSSGKKSPPPSPSLATRLIYIAFIKNFCSFFWAIFKDSVFFKSNAIISYDSSISEKGFDCISK